MTKKYESWFEHDAPSYIAGAKEALNYRGFDDYMVYYTLIGMGMPSDLIDHIGKEERGRVKMVNEKGLRSE